MSKINVLMAVNETTWGLLKQNFQFNADGTRKRTDLTKSQARKLRSNTIDVWPTPEIGGTKYHIIDWFVSPELVTKGDPSSGLKWVEFLLTKWPNKFIIIGAWNKDGSMFGTTLEHYDTGTTEQVEIMDRVVTMIQDGEKMDPVASAEAGEVVMVPNMIEQVSRVGTGQFIERNITDVRVIGTPVYPIHPQYMKAFPDIDIDTPATEPYDICKVAGWADRRWL